MRATVPLFLLLSIVLAAPAFAAEQLYRWKDEHGVTHYSEAPPAGRDFETREIVRDPLLAAEADPTDAAAAAAEPALTAEQCQRARDNLAVFARGGTVSMDLDGDGSAEVLDAAAVARERERMQAFVARCSD